MILLDPSYIVYTIIVGSKLVWVRSYVAHCILCVGWKLGWLIDYYYLITKYKNLFIGILFIILFNHNNLWLCKKHQFRMPSIGRMML